MRRTNDFDRGFVAESCDNVRDGEWARRHDKTETVGLLDDNGLSQCGGICSKPLCTDVQALHAGEGVRLDLARVEPLHPFVWVMG